MSPGDVFPVIIDLKQVLLPKGELSPERWDWGWTIPPLRRFLAGPPFSACVLTDIQLYVDPRSKSEDFAALVSNYAFELRLNAQTLSSGPNDQIINGSGLAAPAIGTLSLPRPRYSFTLKPGDRLTAALMVKGTPAAEEVRFPFTHGAPFVASEDLRFSFTLLGMASDNQSSTGE